MTFLAGRSATGWEIQVGHTVSNTTKIEGFFDQAFVDY